MTVETAASRSRETQQNSHRLRKLGGAILRPISILAVFTGIAYGYGALRGNPISESPTADIRLEHILEPKAVSIARQVLKINMEKNNNIVVTKPDPNGDTPGEETVSISSIENNQWITIDASMYRDKQGQLDPTTVNDVDITQYDCDPPGTKNGICGGIHNGSEEIEFLLGDDTTYTQGNWGLEDDLSPPGYDYSTLTINTATKSPSENSDSSDAQHAITEAKVFSKVAMIWVQEASNGQVDVPQLKKPTPVPIGTI